MSARKYKVDRDRESLTAYRSFVAEHGEDHFPTSDLAAEYSRLRCEAWGPNLRPLGVSENEDGTFSASFNVWD